MIQLDTESYRQALLEERQRVVDAISYLHEEKPGSLEDETSEIVGSSDNHLAETASATVDREIDYTLEENSEHVLSEIDGALARIEAGTFGTCRTCGQPIDVERLAALPYTTQCIDCKRKAERG
jgi:RNA polymerase-binding protein DksA